MMTQPTSANLVVGLEYVKAVFEGRRDALDALFDDAVSLYHRQSFVEEDLFVRGNERVVTLLSGPIAREYRTLSIQDLKVAQTAEGFSLNLEGIQPGLEYSYSWIEKCMVEVDSTSGKIKQVVRTITQQETPSVCERNSALFVTALKYYQAMVMVNRALCLSDLAADVTYIYGYECNTATPPLVMHGKRNVARSLNESYFNIASQVLVSQLSLAVGIRGFEAEYKREYRVTRPTERKYLEFCFDTLQFNEQLQIVVIGTKVERFTPAPLPAADEVAV